MPVSRLYATGYEPIAETIRYLMASQWTETITPIFLSPQGDGTNPATATKTNFGNTWHKFDNQNVIKFHTGIDIELTHGRYFSEFQTTIFIDILARTNMHISIFRNEVDRITFENQPNVNRRLTTSDGGTSEVTGFIQNTPAWTYPGDLTEFGASVMASGELDCKWQIHLSV